MLGRFLKAHGWHKKPVTHAALLWALVAFAALMLLGFLSYGGKLAAIRTGLVEAKPAKTHGQRNLPSAFGRIVSVDGGDIGIESKQPYSRISVDDVTEVTRVGGAPFDPAELAPGMTVMATGHADGERIIADALVILTTEDLDTANE